MKQKLPPIGEIVIANVKVDRAWPSCLGGSKVMYKHLLVKRIKSSSNSQGWQWSGAYSESLINGKVVSWQPVQPIAIVADPDDEGCDDDAFYPCDDCDLPDACADFGCAIKCGISRPKPYDL